MSEPTPFDFGKLLPGFDFLQKLATGGAGGAGVPPGLRHWAAPTVNVEELDQRISELKAVQFWLEQNLMGLKATVQALEVQKMTLVTLQGMNLSVAEIAKGFTLPQADARAEAEQPPAAKAAAQWPYSGAESAPVVPTGVEDPVDAEEGGAPPEEAKIAKQPAEKRLRSARAKAQSGPPAASATGATDPVQWWGALTQQFQQLAAQTLRDAALATPNLPDTPAEATPASRKKAATVRKTAAKKAPARKKAAAKKTKSAASESPFSSGWPLPGKTMGRAE